MVNPEPLTANHKVDPQGKEGEEQQEGEKHRRSQQRMIDRVIIIKILVDRKEQQPEIGQDHPKLRDEIVCPADLGGGCRKAGFALAQGLGSGQWDEGQGEEEGDQCDPGLRGEGTEEHPLQEQEHQGEGEAGLLCSHGQDR